MTRVGFQGEKGANSEEAIRQHFGAEVETVPLPAFRDLFQAVESGRVDHAALPVENSTAGSILQSYDLLLEYTLSIAGEIIFRVRHALLAARGTTPADVRVVRSHPQALAQCERYLAERGWRPEIAYDTAGAARDLAASPEPGAAAIASRLAGQLYGLRELAYDIQDVPYNYTRFFVLSREEAPRSPRSKTSIVFVTPHTPGSLHACMGEIATRGLNLCKIESRPLRGIPWEYSFILDFEGHVSEPVVEAALKGLASRTRMLRVLGSYPAGVTEEAPPVEPMAVRPQK